MDFDDGVIYDELVNGDFNVFENFPLEFFFGDKAVSRSRFIVLCFFTSPLETDLTLGFLYSLLLSLRIFGFLVISSVGEGWYSLNYFNCVFNAFTSYFCSPFNSIIFS